MTPYYRDDSVTIYLGDVLEIEEKYCEIAANRCRQEVLGLSA